MSPKILRRIFSDEVGVIRVDIIGTDKRPWLREPGMHDCDGVDGHGQSFVAIFSGKHVEHSFAEGIAALNGGDFG